MALEAQSPRSEVEAYGFAALPSLTTWLARVVQSMASPSHPSKQPTRRLVKICHSASLAVQASSTAHRWDVSQDFLARIDSTAGSAQVVLSTRLETARTVQFANQEHSQAQIRLSVCPVRWETTAFSEFVKTVPLVGPARMDFLVLIAPEEPQVLMAVRAKHARRALSAILVSHAQPARRGPNHTKTPAAVLHVRLGRTAWEENASRASPDRSRTNKLLVASHVLCWV
eukprot:SAG31_NODE_724_length_12555_cov_11.624277_9_plen_228_part_00